MKKVLALLLALMMALSLVACNSPNTSNNDGAENTSGENGGDQTPSDSEEELEPYTFALYAPLTGDNAQYGLTYQTAIEIYVENRNAEGGINGHPIENSRRPRLFR